MGAPKSYREWGTWVPDPRNEEGLTYEEQVERWAHSLTDAEVNSFAYDYRQGVDDEPTRDGYLEYLRRRPYGRWRKGPDKASEQVDPQSPAVQAMLDDEGLMLGAPGDDSGALLDILKGA